jgi:hypothetical protein
MTAISHDHLADQAEMPQQDEAEEAEPGEDQPVQHGTVIDPMKRVPAGFAYHHRISRSLDGSRSAGPGWPASLRSATRGS